MRDWLISLRGDMSVVDAAERIGITPQYYNYIERGERQKKMDIQMCEKIAVAFHASLFDVIRMEIAHNATDENY